MNDSSASPPRTTGGGWRWEPPTPEELQRMLPQYSVECLVGRGGMGAVYKGVQLSLERIVAIKLLPPAIEQQDTAFAERFKNEAKLMGRLNHPAIVSVYDFGRTTDGQLYFVMEFVDGTDVQRMIAREGRLLPEHALAVTAHLCDALGYAHRQGIVHRDIKPSNVLIDSEGRVKVADFGLAKLTSNPLTSGLTQTGMAMGTPDYVAPETLSLGTDVDGRADLYAVGVMLYQMLTGEIPRGMFKMPSQKYQGIDPRFDNIIRHALEHDREERYQTSHELRRDLDVILTTPMAVAGQQSSAALPKQAMQPHQTQAQTGRTVVPSSRNPGSSSQRRPQPQFELPVPEPAPPDSSSTLPYIIFALVILGVGGWFVTQRQHPASETTETSSQPAAPPSAPSTPLSKPPASSPTTPVTSPPSTPPKSPTSTVVTKPATPKMVTPLRSTPPKKSPTPPPSTPPVPTPPPASASVSDRLTAMESQFQEDFERTVNATYSDLIATLGTNYIAALDRAMSDATRLGRLDEAIALRDEKQRFTTHKFMPSIDPASLHSSVVKLRNTYRGAEKSYAQDKDRKSLPLYDNYIRALDTWAKELDAQGRVGDASRLRIKRDDVVARRKQRAAKLPAGADVPAVSPASSKMAFCGGGSLNDSRINDITARLL